MNLKLFVGIGLLVTANIWAQGYFGGETESSSEVQNSQESTEAAPEAIPAPVYTAPVESSVSSEAPAGGDESLKDFTNLHGNAYNNVGNEGASNNVRRRVNAPHSMKNLNLVYFEPTAEYGLVSFTKGNTYYLALDNSDNVGLMTLGLAMDGMGFSFDLGLGKTFASSEAGDGTESSITTVFAGDEIGANFSMPLGNLAFLAHMSWTTTEDEISTETEIAGTTVENNQSFWDLLIEAEINTNFSAPKDFSWAGGISILRHNLTTEAKAAATTTAADPNSHIEIAPYFNASLKVLENDRARVFVGSNNTLGIQMFDEITNTSDGRLEFGLFLAPNIFAEVALTKNWMFFGGASHNLNLFAYSSDGVGNASSSVLQMLTEQTIVQIGSRFQWKSIALEASLADAFLNNPFNSFNGGALAFNLGAFIYF